jgi:hypothetical protein
MHGEQQGGEMQEHGAAGRVTGVYVRRDDDAVRVILAQGFSSDKNRSLRTMNRPGAFVVLG